MSLFDLDLISRATAPVGAIAVRSTFEDAVSWPQWCSPVHTVRHAPTTWDVGAQLSFVLNTLGRVSFDVQLDEVTDTVISWSATKGPIRGTRTWTFESQGDHTLITDHKRFESSWVPIRLIYPRPIIRRMSERWLADLAREATRRSQ